MGSPRTHTERRPLVTRIAIAVLAITIVLFLWSNRHQIIDVLNNLFLYYQD